jgi:hypothetical protein
VGADLAALKRALYAGGLLTPASPGHRAGAAGGRRAARLGGGVGGAAHARGLAGGAGRPPGGAGRLGRPGRGRHPVRRLRLQELFRPRTFLNALRQQTARRAAAAGGAGAVSMDSLKLVSAWDPGLLAAAPVVVSLAGLLLQGAGFDAGRGCLAEAAADAQEVLAVPHLALAWVPPAFPDPTARAPRWACPCTTRSTGSAC